MIHDFTLTLNGSIQRLSDVFGDGVGVAKPAKDIPYRALNIQPDGANAGAVYVGASATLLSSSAYGVRLPPAVGGDPGAPFILEPGPIGAPVKISDLYVLGTANDKLHVLGLDM